MPNYDSLPGETLHQKDLRIEREAAKELEQKRKWMALPHVEAACTIRWALQSQLETVIDRMTPDEWIALRDRLSA